jgi:hypothetical protein
MEGKRLALFLQNVPIRLVCLTVLFCENGSIKFDLSLQKVGKK